MVLLTTQIIMLIQPILMGEEGAEDPLEIIKNFQIQEQIDQAMLNM